MLPFSLLVDLLSFLYDALVAYAETPEGAAKLQKIEQDLAGLSTGVAETKPASSGKRSSYGGTPDGGLRKLD